MKIEKKDLVYGIIILILVIVAILTVKLGDNVSVVDYFGFAGTLIGIILAVVALIYAFYQSSVYGSATTSLDESAKKIEVVTQNLENITLLESSIAQMASSVHNLSDDLPEKIEKLHAVIDMLSNTQIELHTITRNEIVKSFYETKSTEVKKPDENEINILNYLINSLSRYQFLFLNYIIIAHQNDINLSVQDFACWALEVGVVKSETKVPRDVQTESLVAHFVGDAMGMSRIFIEGGFFKIKGTNTEAKVTLAHQKISSVVENRVLTNGEEARLVEELSTYLIK